MKRKTIAQRITMTAGRGHTGAFASAFFGVGGATPAFDPGFQILGLLIYTYEPQTEVENSALNSPNLRGKIPLKKQGVRYAVDAPGGAYRRRRLVIVGVGDLGALVTS